PPLAVRRGARDLRDRRRLRPAARRGLHPPQRAAPAYPGRLPAPGGSAPPARGRRAMTRLTSSVLAPKVEEAWVEGGDPPPQPLPKVEEAWVEGSDPPPQPLPKVEEAWVEG